MKKDREVLERVLNELFDEYSANKKIVIDTDSNILNIVTIKDKKICSCTCGEEIPCKHMIKVSSKYRLDINLKPESTIKPRKKSTAKAVKSNLKIVGK
jgi:acetone carboxylase gamma subunit